MNAKIERGGGVQVSPNRDRGTGDGVQFGTCRYEYFPASWSFMIKRPTDRVTVSSKVLAVK